MFCAGISEDRSQRVELLLAWLRDEASAATVAGIDERHYKLSAVSDQPDSLIPLSLAADLELIAAECVAHDDVRAVVTNLARALLRQRAEVLDAAATNSAGSIYPFPVNSEAAAGEHAPADYVAGPKKKV